MVDFFPSIIVYTLENFSSASFTEILSVRPAARISTKME